MSHRGYSTEIGRTLVRLIDIQKPKRDTSSGVSGRVTRVVSNTERHLLGLGCERLVDGLFTGVSVQNHIDFGGPRLWPRPTEVWGKYGGNATLDSGISRAGPALK